MNNLKFDHFLSFFNHRKFSAFYTLSDITPIDFKIFEIADENGHCSNKPIGTSKFFELMWKKDKISQEDFLLTLHQHRTWSNNKKMITDGKQIYVFIKDLSLYLKLTLEERLAHYDPIKHHLVLDVVPVTRNF